MAPRFRSVLQHAALACLGVVLGVIVLEAVMYGVASFVAREEAAGPSSLLRVVALGDSNTFGLYVGKDHAYPRLVQTLWQEGSYRPAIEVLNLGYPGTNSSMLRNRFLDVLARYRPQVVTILIGANDFWTVPEPLRGESVGFLQWLWRYSRVYRLLYMTQRALAVPGREQLPDVPDEPVSAPKRGGVPEWEHSLRQNIAFLVVAAREVGVRPILLTYGTPWPPYAGANAEIRRAADETHALLIDLTPAFGAECRYTLCPLLLADGHPTAAGHQRMAKAIVDDLRRRGLLEARPARP